MPQSQRFDTGADGVIDPSIWRGMTMSRISRRSALRSAGAGLGMLGMGALLQACGVQGAGGVGTGNGGRLPNAGIGTAQWWSKQKLHHVVNFANWPYYVDVLNGKHLTLDRFTAQTGIKVSYFEVENAQNPFFAKIRPALEAHQYTGYDIVILTSSNPPLSLAIDFGWLIPLDQSMLGNFRRYASPLVRGPAWDPHNKYTLVYQSGWTAIGYNSSVVKNPGDSFGILFDKKYAGRVGMFSDPQELGSAALLALGIDPATSTEADWLKAAKLLKQQKSDGIVRAYYDQSYIDHLKNGDIVVSQAWSGDIFQADLNSKYRDLRLLMPSEGAMFWSDNWCIPLYAQHPKDAMALMDYFYQPDVEAVLDYYNDYICPVPAAREVLLHPTGWAKQALAAMYPEVQLSPSVTANAPTVFPTPRYIKLSRSYYQYKSEEELNAWNNIFVPITEGA